MDKKNKYPVNLFKLGLDYFVFSNLYIACLAVLMVYQTQLLFSKIHSSDLLFFTFFSSTCSYNLHWFLTRPAIAPIGRDYWSSQNKKFQLFLFWLSLPVAIFYFFLLKKYWFWLGFTAFMTFLYTAPKIPYPIFKQLKKIAIGKTIFLSLVWTMVTVLLPYVVLELKYTTSIGIFFTNRFFLIYSICILFDWRDRETDHRSGIKSLITRLSAPHVKVLYYASIIIFFVSGLFQFLFFGFYMAVSLFVPGIVLIFINKYAFNSRHDYFYYIFLDGLMALSALLLIISPLQRS